MRIENGMIHASEGMWINRKGDKAQFKSAYVLKNDTLSNFEERAELFPEDSEINYDEEVNNLIREKYTESQEFAILRQRDTKPQEFEEYNAYCEECKKKVKARMI